jgi:predicted RNA binding protein YcfA (HicA-like mRNA interferase family)
MFNAVLPIVHLCATMSSMPGADFIRCIRKIANRRSAAVHFDARHGKGSHARLYYGDRFTTVKNRKHEIGPGLLRKMLADLGLSIADIEE